MHAEAPGANERDRSRNVLQSDDRAHDRGRAIHEKNRELVNLRSFFLEPALQRVYHVVFAETLHTIKNARGARRRGERRQDQRGRKALDQFTGFFEFESAASGPLCGRS